MLLATHPVDSLPEVHALTGWTCTRTDYRISPQAGPFQALGLKAICRVYIHPICS